MILIILGTRPEIIKLYPIIDIFIKKKQSFKILHTGQHYSNKLSNQFLKQLQFPKNKIINLKVGSGNHGDQTSAMIIGIEEQRLERYNEKVVPCPGSKIKDMYNNIAPLLKKKPSKVIVHVGTNDTPYKPSCDIVKELVMLRKFIENHLPGSKVFLSSPIMRVDNQLANSTIRKINNDLKNISNVIMNDKLDGHCLGRKGLHLNQQGSGKLAVNFITQMQCV